MRLFLKPRLFLIFFVTVSAANAAIAETKPASHEEVEELRQTVRELATRVSALEEELNRQKSAAVVDTASMKPAVFTLPAANIRSSVESISSSGIAGGVYADCRNPDHACDSSAPDGASRRSYVELHARRILRV